MQRRDKPDPATFIGKGKAEELRELVGDEAVEAAEVQTHHHGSQNRQGLNEFLAASSVPWVRSGFVHDQILLQVFHTKRLSPQRPKPHRYTEIHDTCDHNAPRSLGHGL